MSKAPPPESAEGVYSSVTKAAEAMGIKPPQLHVWRKQNGFPGWDGHYPVEEILAWRETVRVGRPRGQTETKVDFANELRRIRVEEKLGQLIDVETVEREIIRAYEYAVSELHLLCGRIESQLPNSLDPAVVARIRNSVLRAVDGTIGIIKTAVEGEEDL